MVTRRQQRRQRQQRRCCPKPRQSRKRQRQQRQRHRRQRYLGGDTDIKINIYDEQYMPKKVAHSTVIPYADLFSIIDDNYYSLFKNKLNSLIEETNKKGDGMVKDYATECQISCKVLSQNDAKSILAELTKKSNIGEKGDTFNFIIDKSSFMPFMIENQKKHVDKFSYTDMGQIDYSTWTVLQNKDKLGYGNVGMNRNETKLNQIKSNGKNCAFIIYEHYYYGQQCPPKKARIILFMTKRKMSVGINGHINYNQKKAAPMASPTWLRLLFPFALNIPALVISSEMASNSCR